MQFVVSIVCVYRVIAVLGNPSFGVENWLKNSASAIYAIY